MMTILSIEHFWWPIGGLQLSAHAVVLGTFRGQVLARHPRDCCPEPPKPDPVKRRPPTTRRFYFLSATSEAVESPRKKSKLSIGSTDPTIRYQQQRPPAIDAQIQKELDVGITSFVGPHAHAFSGILKKRYIDFLVNEILPNGQVLHLRSTRPPPQQVGRSDDTGA